MEKSASAHWEGSLKEGKGTISTESGALSDSAYGFPSRFESEPGTNPEELVGAAHAACYSMALSMLLGEEGFTPESIDTRARVKLEKQDDGFAVTTISLQCRARVPGIESAAFETVANKAKEGCPISKLVTAEVTLDAQLEE